MVFRFCPASYYHIPTLKLNFRNNYCVKLRYIFILLFSKCFNEPVKYFMYHWYRCMVSL